MSELQSKIEKLPTWARQHIKELEKRANENPMREERNDLHRRNEELRKKVRKLEESNEAILEILRKAGEWSDGSDIARKIVGVLDGYEIYKNGPTEEDLLDGMRAGENS